MFDDAAVVGVLDRVDLAMTAFGMWIVVAPTPFGDIDEHVDVVDDIETRESEEDDDDGDWLLLLLLLLLLLASDEIAESFISGDAWGCSGGYSWLGLF